MPAVAGFRFTPPEESGHPDQLAAVVEGAHDKTVIGRIRSQALPDCLQGYSFVFCGRLAEGSRLKLQGFEAELLIRLGVLSGQAADIHGWPFTVYRQTLDEVTERYPRNQIASSGISLCL